VTASDSYSGRAEHLWILALAITALAGSWILEPSNEGCLLLSVPILGVKVLLPQICVSRTLLGVPCPGCGMTRSFAALIRGDILKAVIFNPMGPVLFLACLFQIPYRIIEYTGIWNRNSLWDRFRQRLDALACILLAGLMVVWIARLVCFFSAHDNLRCAF
jgi:hypothetical protein